MMAQTRVKPRTLAHGTNALTLGIDYVDDITLCSMLHTIFNL